MKTFSKIANLTTSDPVFAVVSTNPVLVPDPTRHVLIDTTEKQDKSRESIYQYVGGDPARPLTSRLGHYPKKDGLVNESVKINAVGILVEDGVESDSPIAFTIAYSGPGGVALSTSDIGRLAAYAIAMMRPSTTPVSAIVTADRVYEQLQYGITNGVLAVYEGVLEG